MKNKPLFIVATLAAFVLLVPSRAVAYGGTGYTYQGTTLYYSIVSSTEVHVTYPNPTPFTAFAWDGYTKPTGDVVIPSTISFNGSVYMVTGIDQCAFIECDNMASITLPSSLTTIGPSAFFGTYLTNLVIPNSVTTISSYAFTTVRNVVYNGNASGSPWEACGVNGILDGDFYFADAQKTTLNSYIGNGSSVTIPSTVVTMSEYAFAHCLNLTSVTLPDGLTTLPDRTFYQCYNLSSINFPEGLIHIGSGAFQSCKGLTSVNIPNSVNTIGGYAFEYCTNLGSVNIPSSVTSIGSLAFDDVPHIEYYGTAMGSPWGARTMNGIVEGDYVYLDEARNIVTAYIGAGGTVTIPSTVTTINQDAFKGCERMTSLTIPSNVTSLGNSCFSECTGLTSAHVDGSIVYMGSFVFDGDSSLTSITFGDNVQTIGRYCASYCQNLTDLTIGNGVRKIEEGAFCECTALHPVTIPSSVDTIEYLAFYNVNYITYHGNATGSPWGALHYNAEFAFEDDAQTVLTAYLGIGGDVTIPSYTTTIADGAFQNCISVTSVIIPESVTSIGNHAFAGCTGLETIHLQADVPPTVGNNTFSNINSNCVVYVPCGSIEAYQISPDWSVFDNFRNEGVYLVITENIMGGTVSVIQPTCNNSVATLTAIPEEEYVFHQWSDGSVENPRTLTLVSDSTIVAYFALIVHDTVTVYVHDTSYVNLHDTTIVTVHDTVTNTVYDTVTNMVYDTVTNTVYDTVINTVYDTVTNTVYDTVTNIVHDTVINTVYDTVTNTVYDTVTNTVYDTVTNTLYDTVTNTVYDTVDNYIHDTTIVIDTLWMTQYDTIWLHDTVIVYDTVYITPEGIDGVEGETAKVYSSQGQIVVEGAGGAEVMLYDAIGRRIDIRRDDYTAVRFDIPASGIYLVKVGNTPARRIVVVR